MLGRDTGTEKWQAVVSTELHPPEKADTILRNPLGLYITSVNWTRITN